MINENLLKKAYLPRKEWTHKGQHGKVLIVGGSQMYTGATGLSALAAIKTGCDINLVIGPKRAMDITATFWPDIVTYPLNGTNINERHISTIVKLAKARNFHALAIGPGMERTPPILKAIIKIINQVNLPTIADDDAIYAISKHGIDKDDLIVTPQAYEFSVLTGETPNTKITDRRKLVKEKAKELGLTILLKGHIDVISNGRRTDTNSTGNEYMTKGGFGDTLSGIGATLLSRGLDTFTSAAGAAYINGKAGEYAIEKYGESATGLDLVNNIYKVIK